MVHPLSAVGSREEILTRALEVWVIKARQMGWRVEIAEGHMDPAAGLCGRVDVEGIRYVIRCGPRRRGVLLDDSTGRPVPKPILKRTVWAEPVVEEHLLTD
ncbi:hypothetical protein DMB38_32155 [Streptomyces sp. WAC 06738]|uniref:hypothetical protein n=1 Tax=Streptomyces sp. WAC 06738 TaxID=2203210 RepID=UPI000F6CFFC0|nr:hypothetical protein [Streptomyces sp. WAC 06738]AZM49818.1 hypothetical protein DMB38_32155 [Streptomyces sp. WAC 06738]